MVHYTKVVAGIADYVEEELVSKLQGSWKAWVLGAAASLAVSRSSEVMTALSANPIANALGVVKGEEIDAEAALREIKKQANKGSITVPIPAIGPVTFGPEDVDKLYRYIQRSESA
jgi:hypothetical protein